MRRVPFALTFALACAALAAASAPVARAGVAPAARRVVAVAVRASTAGEWRADAALGPLLEQGGALLSTRTDERRTDDAPAFAAAFDTFGAGARRSASEPGTALATALAGAGVPFVVSPALQRFLGADPIVPSTGPLPGHLQTPAVAVIDATSAASPDDTLRAVRAALSDRDTLIVFSPFASAGRRAHSISLGVVAVAKGNGALWSPSTRRTGVVTLADLAPTILAELNLPDSMDGRPVEIKPKVHVASYLRALERDLVASARARRPITRGLLAIALAVAAICGALAAFGRRSGFASLALLAVTAAPLGVYVSGAFHPSGSAQYAYVSAAIAVGLALVARAAAGIERAFVAVLGLTVLVPLADLVAGTPLAARSPLAFQIAGGGRFYGVDDGVLGVVVGAHLFAAGLIWDRFGERWRIALAISFAVAVWILGAPALGAKFGAPLTAVPAFAVLALRARGKRIDLKAIATIAVATLAATGAFVLADVLRRSGAQSHVARAVQGHSNVGSLIARKWHENWHITATTIWAPAIAGFAAIVLVAHARIVAALARRPGLRAATVAAIVAVAAGIAFNDEGVITATPVALYIATVTLAFAHAPGA